MEMLKIFNQKRLAGKLQQAFVQQIDLRLFVTAVEFVDTTGGVNKFLFAGEKRVAFGADTDFDFGTGGLDVPDFAASAGNSGITVIRMDILFHCFLTPYLIIKVSTNLCQDMNIHPLCHFFKSYIVI